MQARFATGLAQRLLIASMKGELMSRCRREHSQRSAQRAAYGRIGLALCFVALAFAPSGTLAEPVYQRLEGRASAGAVSLREDLLVPYAFTGPEFNVGASYGIARGRYAFDLSIEFGPAPVWTRAKDSGIYVHNEIAASYHECAYVSARRAFWIGALVRSSHEFAYLASWDDAHGYWLDAIMLGPSLRHAERVSAEHVLELIGDFSVMGAASRPPARRLNKQDALTRGVYHFDRLGEDTKLAWIGQTSFARATGLVRFRREVERFGSGFGLGLETRIAHAKRPQPYTSWYMGVLLSFPWSWK